MLPPSRKSWGIKFCLVLFCSWKGLEALTTSTWPHCILARHRSCLLLCSLWTSHVQVLSIIPRILLLQASPAFQSTWCSPERRHSPGPHWVSARCQPEAGRAQAAQLSPRRTIPLSLAFGASPVFCTKDEALFGR